MPFIFQAVPLGSLRVGTILQALGNRDWNPRIVVFGNSITATAVHAKALSEHLAGAPVVLNLSSAAQTLPESYMLYQEVAPSVRVVIQTFTPWDLTDRKPFPRNRYNAYYGFGYRPNPHTIDVLSRVLGDPTGELLRSSEAAETFRSRWVASRFLDVAFWMNLPAALRYEETAKDVFFFEGSNERLDDAANRFLLQERASRLSAEDPVTFAERRELLRIATRETRDANRSFVLFVPPLHPDIRRLIAPEVSRSFDLLLEEERVSGIEVIDVRDSEPDGAFRDALHLKGEAAARVTRTVAERLSAARLWP